MIVIFLTVFLVLLFLLFFFILFCFSCSIKDIIFVLAIQAFFVWEWKVRVYSLSELETFRFRDKDIYEDEFWLKLFFSRFVKIDTSGSFISLFSPEIRLLARLCLLKEVKPSGDRKMITFDKFVSVTTTRGTMTKAITISRQNDAENLVLLVALVLESNGWGWLGWGVNGQRWWWPRPLKLF